jgi:hypothetical protein
MFFAVMMPSELQPMSSASSNPITKKEKRVPSLILGPMQPPQGAVIISNTESTVQEDPTTSYLKSGVDYHLHSSFVYHSELLVLT